MWSRKHRWQDRILDFDAAAAAVYADMWAERMASHRDDEFEDAMRMREIGRGALNHVEDFFDIKRRIVSPGTPTRVCIRFDADGNEIERTETLGTPAREVITVRLKVLDAARMLDTASRLGRRAINMPTDTVKSDEVIEIRYLDGDARALCAN